VAGSTDGAVRLWDLDRGGATVLAGHVGDIFAVAFVDGGLVSGGEDGTVRLWSSTGTLRSMLHVDGELIALDVTSDGRHLAAGTSNGIAYRWSLDAFGAAAPGTGPLAPFLDGLTVGVIDPGTQALAPR
jgi:WD40 repeat protein